MTCSPIYYSSLVERTDLCQLFFVRIGRILYEPEPCCIDIKIRIHMNVSNAVSLAIPYSGKRENGTIILVLLGQINQL
jgi:hypothetical protein